MIIKKVSTAMNGGKKKAKILNTKISLVKVFIIKSKILLKIFISASNHLVNFVINFQLHSSTIWG